MKKSVSIVVLMFLTVFFYGQNFATTKDKSKGYYKIAANETDKSMTGNKSRVTFKFIGPTGKPINKNVKMVYNNDSLFPKIEENGNYSMNILPGKYKLRFEVPFWVPVATDTLMFRKQGYMSILVKFEAKNY